MKVEKYGQNNEFTQAIFSLCQNRDKDKEMAFVKKHEINGDEALLQVDDNGSIIYYRVLFDQETGFRLFRATEEEFNHYSKKMQQ